MDKVVTALMHVNSARQALGQASTSPAVNDAIFNLDEVDRVFKPHQMAEISEETGDATVAKKYLEMAKTFLTSAPRIATVLSGESEYLVAPNPARLPDPAVKQALEEIAKAIALLQSPSA